MEGYLGSISEARESISTSEDVIVSRVGRDLYFQGYTRKQWGLDPCDGGDPYHPVPRAENATLYKKYEELFNHSPKVQFISRIATCRYYNMGQVVAQELQLCTKLTGRSRGELVRAAIASGCRGRMCGPQV